MDPFSEKELIDLLKSIALSLREIRSELADLNEAVRELNPQNYSKKSKKENNFEEDFEEEIEDSEDYLEEDSEESEEGIEFSDGEDTLVL